MKTAVVLLLLGVLLVPAAVGLTLPKNSLCCPSVSNRGIPIAKVKKVHLTSSNCGVEALIVTNTDGNRHCINPICPWAVRNNETLQNLQKRRS